MLQFFPWCVYALSIHPIHIIQDDGDHAHLPTQPMTVDPSILGWTWHLVHAVSIISACILNQKSHWWWPSMFQDVQKGSDMVLSGMFRSLPISPSRSVKSSSSYTVVPCRLSVLTSISTGERSFDALIQLLTTCSGSIHSLHGLLLFDLLPVLRTLTFPLALPKQFCKIKSFTTQLKSLLSCHFPPH